MISRFICFVKKNRNALNAHNNLKFSINLALQYFNTFKVLISYNKYSIQKTEPPKRLRLCV